ncbi:hypothetical protein D3C71_1808950 [compost metagenome]
MATVSVISHSSCDPGTPCRVSACSMRVTRLLSRNWCAEMLMATRMFAPLRFHSAICRQASSMTQLPSCPIRPKRSASAMNTMGLTMPCCGWFQRSSPSTPQIWPSWPSIFGW